MPVCCPTELLKQSGKIHFEGCISMLGGATEFVHWLDPIQRPNGEAVGTTSTKGFGIQWMPNSAHQFTYTKTALANIIDSIKNDKETLIYLHLLPCCSQNAKAIRKHEARLCECKYLRISGAFTSHQLAVYWLFPELCCAINTPSIPRAVTACRPTK